VADDKAVYPYVPDLVRYYLGEEPILQNVACYDLADADQLAHVLEHLDQLVLKPVDGAGGYGLVIGPQATDEQLATLHGEVEANPRGWVAQDVVRLSTSPTHTGEGLAPRHVDLRPFAVNDGNRVWVVPGGLTRVALPEGSLVVNSSQGGGSKDTWVLAAERAWSPPPSAGLPSQATRHREPIAAEPPELGPGEGMEDQQQQQQQEARTAACAPPEARTAACAPPEARTAACAPPEAKTGPEPC